LSPAPSVPYPHGPGPNFGGLSDEQSDFATASTLILPVPYDGTASYVAGTRRGPQAILTASQNVELYDEELEAEPCARGIATLPELEAADAGPAEMVARVEEAEGDEAEPPVAESARLLNEARAQGKRLTAVGTTTTRVLEFCAGPGGFSAQRGWCDLYIYPGYRFKAVDRLLTNFHLPKSSLLLLVSAFAGRELIMQAYREAIREKYRFYSYGDCMLIL
jgi:hypothetical protein